MKGKILFSCWMLAAVALAGAGMVSCDEEEQPGWMDGEDRVGGVLSSDEHGIVFPYRTVIVGNIPGDVRTALGECLTNVVSTVDDDTRLVVMGSFDDLDDVTLQRAYDNGATIAVVHPSQASVDAFFAKHPRWEGHTEDDDLNGALLYSFDRDACNFLILGEDDDSMTIEYSQEEGDDVEDSSGTELGPDPEVETVSFLDYHNPIYTYIGPWLDQLRADEQGRSIASTHSRAEGRLNKPNTILYSKTFTKKFEKEVYRYNKNNIDKVTGNIAVTIQYEVAQLHLYEGEPGAGDYYLVKMYASLSSHDAYKGKWRNCYYGVYNRAVGFYAKNFSVTNRIWTDTLGTKAPVTLYEAPTPSTTNGATQYTTSHTFNWELSLGVTGGGGMEGGKPNWGVEGKAEAKVGWSDTNTETRTIHDVEIQEITSGNYPAWNIVFQNLPKYNDKAQYGFDEGSALPFRSTQMLVGSWIWHEPNSKDDVVGKSYYIVPDIRAEYEAQSFITTKADLKTHSLIVKSPRKKNDKGEELDEEDIASVTKFKLRAMPTSRVGGMQLKNDFSDKYISNIMVYRTDVDVASLVDGENNVCFENKNSFAPGEAVDLGYYMICYAYRINFKANVPGEEPQIYEYSLNPNIPLSYQEHTILHAANDFKPIEE